jgi:CheY-like chemotaxis protein
MCSVVDERSLGKNLGAAECLVKPVTSEQILAALSRVCARPGRVLLVEDDPNTLDGLRQDLEGEPYELMVADRGERALALLAEQRIDAVVLDLMMPELDGFAVLDALDRDPALSRIPVLVVTAKDLTVEEARRLRERATQVIRKNGLAPEQIVSGLRAALQAEARVAE